MELVNHFGPLKLGRLVTTDFTDGHLGRACHFGRFPSEVSLIAAAKNHFSGFYILKSCEFSSVLTRTEIGWMKNEWPFLSEDDPRILKHRGESAFLVLILSKDL